MLIMSRTMEIANILLAAVFDFFMFYLLFFLYYRGFFLCHRAVLF